MDGAAPDIVPIFLLIPRKENKDFLIFHRNGKQLQQILSVKRHPQKILVINITRHVNSATGE